MWFKKNILDKLPKIANIENIIFSQTTEITDKNWIVLYKLFNENRKYVWIEDISKTMQNAIIWIEDKNFWKNPWIDFQWIIRAWMQDVFFWKTHWASTITQQLIKNLLLTDNKTITRKIKEIVLAFELNDYLTNKVNKEYKWLTQDQVKTKVKEKILEMYVNYVFFGNNAYGIEAAAKTYFKKDAKNLNILESCILASIPKSPTNYNPITNRYNNLWQLQAFSSSWESFSLTWNFGWLIQDAYISSLNDKTFAIFKNEQDIIDLLSPKNLYYKDIHIKYLPWRKDYVLSRMYIDGYIDKTEFIQAIKEWFDKKIYSPKIQIKAPHFVFSVITELEEKYWKNIIENAWWTIKTSLDYNIQEIAEKSVSNWSWYLDKKWSNNAALLYVDSKNGDILAYVWSKDYYNKEIDGQVDIITSKRQCWSVIKPLIYTNAFIENKTFTPEMPIYDTNFYIADKENTFNNFDGSFLWILPIRKALSYSRNIPAAKMYFLWWGDTKVKSFLKSIWIKTISDNIYYGYPLSIWALDVSMIDMAQAYSNLSNIENPVKINPILEIKWPDGSIIYKKQPEKLEKIIPTWVVSFLWYILSNPANRPSTWNSVMQIEWLTIATKSWTTNMIDPKTWIKYPRDGWFIAYTPSKIFINWTWNTKWEHMHADAYGWWTAWKIWRDFVLKLKEKNLIKNENMALKWITNIYVNTLNWKKSSQYTPVQLSKQTIARTNWIPENDKWENVKMIQIDRFCTGLVSEYTPKNDIKNAYVIYPFTYKKDDTRWNNSIDIWRENIWLKKYENILNATILLNKEPTTICESRSIIAEKWILDFNITSPENNQNLARVFDILIDIKNAPFALKNIEIYIDWKLVQNTKYKNNIVWVYLLNNITFWPHNMIIKIVDEKWYFVSKNLNINIIEKDNTPPFLDTIKENQGKFIYIFKDENSRVLWWKLYCDDKEIIFNWPKWVWNIKDCWYYAVDYYSNILKKNK